MATNTYESSYRGMTVAELPASERATFIGKTYLHLTGAIVAFTLLEMYLFQSGAAVSIAKVLMSGSWLLVLGGFMVVSWIASWAASTVESKPLQYLALTGFVVAEAIIFVPLLLLAQHVAPGVIQSAAVVTLFGFAALTAIVLLTRKDFSFLRTIIFWGGILALGAIVGAVIFKFDLGTWFSVAMVGLAGASILYDTSNVLHRYPEDRYVSAALQLFASVALMFWYVLRLFMRR